MLKILGANFLGASPPSGPDPWAGTPLPLPLDASQQDFGSCGHFFGIRFCWFVKKRTDLQLVLFCFQGPRRGGAGEEALAHPLFILRKII